MDARPCEEIWIVAPADGTRIWGEALIGLVYRDSAGRGADRPGEKPLFEIEVKERIDDFVGDAFGHGEPAFDPRERRHLAMGAITDCGGGR